MRVNERSQSMASLGIPLSSTTSRSPLKQQRPLDRNLSKQSMLFQMKEEVMMAQYREELNGSPEKQGNRKSALPISRSSSVNTPNSQISQPHYYHQSKIPSIDEQKFETTTTTNKVIIPMPNVPLDRILKFKGNVKKKSSLIETNRPSPFDYIEIDKPQYKDHLKYLLQQPSGIRPNVSRYALSRYHTQSTLANAGATAATPQLIASAATTLQPVKSRFHSCSPQPQDHPIDQLSSFYGGESPATQTLTSTHQSFQQQQQQQQQQHQQASLNTTTITSSSTSHTITTNNKNNNNKNFNKNILQSQQQQPLPSTHSLNTTCATSSIYGNSANESMLSASLLLESSSPAPSPSLLRTRSLMKQKSKILKFDDPKRGTLLDILPFNEQLFSKISKNTKDTLSTFVETNTKQPIPRRTKSLHTSIDPAVADRMQTFFQFAFTSEDKEDYAPISNAMNKGLFENPRKNTGSMQVIDLWSAKTLKLCVDRTNMHGQKNVVQNYLYNKTKNELKKQLQANLIVRNKELDTDDDEFDRVNHSSSLAASAVIEKSEDDVTLEETKDTGFKKAINGILKSIDGFQKNNQKDIKIQVLQQELHKRIGVNIGKKIDAFERFKLSL